MFRDIVIYLRRLHKVDMLCGDLVNMIFIVLAANTAHFSCLQLRGTGLSIRHDPIHFRFLVGMLTNLLLRRNPHYCSLVTLLIDFHLFFFSKIFSLLNDVQEYNSIQLLHPLFYDKKTTD